MSNMNFFVLSISNPEKLTVVLAQVVSEDFSLSIERAKSLIENTVEQHWKRFRKDTKIVIERNYLLTTIVVMLT